MDHNITNCIQKTWTELCNMVIFCTNIRTRIRYSYYLDIFKFLHIRTEFI